MRYTFWIILSCFALFTQAQKLELGKDCQPNQWVVKIKKGASFEKLAQDIQSRFPQAQAKIIQLFPHPVSTKEGKDNLGRALVDISSIYQVECQGVFDYNTIYQHLKKNKHLIYAEPKYIHHVTYTPNDPSLVFQWQIGKIQAEQAWDIQQGDSAFVVGVIDTGTDITHDDLASNVKHNIAEIMDGLDNDGDGYIDNRLGWDFVDNDNNPDAVSSNWAHGVSVAGCAAAKTNNTTGIAGPAFNGKFIPIRAGSGLSVSHGYEGIVYAAEHGCKYINCSWGGNFSSLFEQDIIDYVSNNLGCLVIAGAGNNANSTEFYPAAYDQVLAVAATNSNDQKAGFSCYGSWVDISAPGDMIYTTGYGNGYTYNSGTSFSSPITAGAAALVNAQFSTYTPAQIGALLKATATNISSQNPSYIGLLGTGRLNLWNAVQFSNNTPAVELINYELTDYQGDVFSPGDTAELRATFLNYLSPTGNCTAIISSSSPYVTFLNNNIPYGVIATMSSVDNNLNPWKIKISTNAPFNENVTLNVTITDGAYTYTSTISMIINREYINITANEIGVTVTSKGGFGFNDFTAQQQGIGFIYPYTSGGSNLLYEGGLLIGTSGKVSDIVRSGAGVNDIDFYTLNYVSRTVPGFSDFDVSTRFNDGSSTSPLPVEVLNNTYAWNMPGHEKYVMSEYFIINQGSTTLSGLHAGIYCDWDVEDYSLNKAATDATRNLGYVYYDDGSTSMFAGTQLLYPFAGFSHYGFDHTTGGAGGIDVTDDYTTSEKYTSLSTQRQTAGGALGTDVSHVVGAGPFTIAPGDTQRVVFALLAGDNLMDLALTADSAASHFDQGVITSSALSFGLPSLSIYPNPTDGAQDIIFEPGTSFSLDILDIKGVLYKHLSIQTAPFSLDISDLPAGVYIYSFQSQKDQKQYRVIKL